MRPLPTATLLLLPDDVLYVIVARFCDLQSVGRLLCTSPRLRATLDHDDALWQAISQRIFGAPEALPSDCQTWRQYARDFGDTRRWAKLSPARELRMDANWVWSVRVDIDRDLMAVGDGSNSVSMYRLSTFELLRKFDGHSGSIRMIEFDGKRLLTASADHTAREWDLDTGRALHMYPRQSDFVVSVDFTSDTVLTACEDNSISIHRRMSDELVGHVPNAHQSYAWQAKFMGDSVVSTGGDGHVKFFDLASLNLLQDIVVSTSTHWSLATSERLGLVMSGNTTARWYDVRTYQEVGSFVHSKSIVRHGLVGNLGVVAGHSGRVSLFDLRRPAAALAHIEVSGDVWGMDLQATLLALASFDNHVRVYRPA